MRCVAPLALALLLHAASTSAQSESCGYGCEISNISKQIALVEKYYGSSLTACASKLSSNTQFLLSVPACSNQRLPQFNATVLNCTSSCKRMFIEGGPSCVEQYNNLIASMWYKAYQHVANGAQLDPTTAELIVALNSNNSALLYPVTPEEKSKADNILSATARFYSSFSSVCGAAVASSGSEGMEGPLVTVLLALVFTWVLLLK